MRHLRLCLLLFLIVLVAACEAPPNDEAGEEEPLVVYSGRSRALVDALVERYEEATGAPVEVRYGTDAQLLAALNEEGEASQADLFWANTTGALATAIGEGLLQPLPDSLTERAAAYAPSDGEWTPVTTRFRVLAYNTERVDSTQLPSSVMDLPDEEQFAGRIGWTPSYSSFQDFVTAMREVHGDDATTAWLEAMQELEPEAYSSNTPMIEALAAGEIDLALTNHYYVLRATQGDAGAGAPLAIYHFAPGDVGNLALVTGAGLLSNTGRPEAAARFLSFLLSEEAQRYAAEEVYEYPIIEGAQVPGYMTSVDEALELSPDFDFERLSDLDATLALMREAGVL